MGRPQLKTKGQTAAHDAAGDFYVLRLYISGATEHSRSAVENVKAVAEKHLKGRYRLSVTDIYQDTARARREQVVAVPMLVRQRPLPVQRIIGDLTDDRRMLQELGISRPMRNRRP